MPSPICVPCKQEMVCDKNECVACDVANEPFPSTYWVGTRWKCPKCGNLMLAHFGARPLGASGLTPRELAGALEFKHD